MGHTYAMWWGYLLGTYVRHVKCMYGRPCGDTVDYIEFILGIYTDIVVSSLHELICIHGISMAFEGCICCWHMHGYCMENKSCNLVFLFSTCRYNNVGSACRPHYLISWPKKSCFTSFYHLYPRNSLVPLMTPLGCNADASPNGVTWPKKLILHLSIVLTYKNTMVPLMTLLTWCNSNTGANSVFDQTLCCTSS